MSRIQEILKKAEREGSVQRTRALATEAPAVSGATALAPEYEPPAWQPAPEPLRTPPAAAHVGVPAPVATRGRQAAGSLDPRLVATSAPRSLAAEQYRSLRTRVARAEAGTRVYRAIIITSPAKGDGKSLTAANLALTMAEESQHRVLLVDADLRCPSIHTLFGVPETPGLTDVLMGGATLDDALLSFQDERLTVLPSGMVPSHPAELLGSTGMRRLMDTLRARFDRIVLDMPPVAPLADVSVASSLADGILMIVRAGVTPKPAIERALAGLEVSKVIGLVLNDAGDTGADYRYGSYGYIAG